MATRDLQGLVNIGCQPGVSGKRILKEAPRTPFITTPDMSTELLKKWQTVFKSLFYTLTVSSQKNQQFGRKWHICSS